MILVYCYDCEQVKYSFPRDLSCLSCGSRLVDEIPPIYSPDEEEDDLDEQDEEEEEQEGADFDQQSMLQRLANTGSPLATINFQFIPRRGSLGLEEVKFRQWVMRHLLWNGDMTQMPIEILSSPLSSQFTTTDEQEASHLFRNWVMRQVPLPQQQEDRSTAFVQWIKKHILGDRTELDYRRKMRQALNFPLQEISQQETSAYRTRVFRVLGEQNRFHSTMLSDFERGFDFPDPYYDIDNDTDEEDELEEYIPSIHDVIGYDEEDEEDTLDTSDEDDDAGTFTETDELDGLSDTSDRSGIVPLLPFPSLNTLNFINDFIGDHHDDNDSGPANLSVLDELISEIRTRTSRREQQSSSQIMQSLTEKRLAQDDPEYQTECSICQEIFAKEKLYSLPCHHLYHSECITQWIRLKSTCPICRYELSPPTSTYRSFRDDPDIQDALRELDRHEQESLHDYVGEEPAGPESGVFMPEYDAGSDDGFDGTGHIPDYIDTSTHIRTILERWPTEIWSDDDDEEEEEEEDDDDDGDGDYLPSTIDLNLFLFDSDRSSQQRYPTLSSRRVIDPDQDDHLWSPSSLTDLSLSVDVWNESPRSSSSLSHTLDEWHESPTSDLSSHLHEWNESGSDSSIQYLGSTNDYQHPFYDDSARIVMTSRHLDQPFYDDMDIE